MRHFFYVEIENFKLFGEKQRIDLDHPSVLIGPNNCGKTSVIQAIALWSQAIKTWYSLKGDSSARERAAAALNRLSIVSVPVKRTKYFWHNTRVSTGKENIYMTVTLGLLWLGDIVPLRMKFRFQGDELIYCTPDDSVINNNDFLKYAASINVELLYPMSGLVTEEPVLKPGRINVLLGQGDTAEVLRNLCLSVYRNSIEDWKWIVDTMQRLFSIQVATPMEDEVRGDVTLTYKEPEVSEPLDIAMAGRGFQQLLLLFSYLFSHKKSVLLIDEPDAHLEILRQRQIYILLREIARLNKSQAIMATHSEVVLDEALDNNLTLILNGSIDGLASKSSIRETLKNYGAEHYVKARDRGYVLYVEGTTDVDMLRALAERMSHPVAAVWDDKINVYYVRDTHPESTLESELERVEGGFGISPKDHFNALKKLIPNLHGLAILDNDGRNKQDYKQVDFQIVFWRRYEAENYFITPDLLKHYALSRHAEPNLFNNQDHEVIEEVMNILIKERLFEGSVEDFSAYQKADKDVSRLIWETKTDRIKLSDFAEEYFRRLSDSTKEPMMLRKGELHSLIELIEPSTLSVEIKAKLDLLLTLFSSNKL
ncbi:MAG: AAA family ATPase [Spirochaetes bacterium]|nr:MAG: AAA family ATPase [Spirochaetota bacterium]